MYLLGKRLTKALLYDSNVKDIFFWAIPNVCHKYKSSLYHILTDKSALKLKS